MQIVLGVDSSTQSTKVEARNVDSGEVVATGRSAHPPTEPPVSEQDPHSWWEALVNATTQLGRHREDVIAISVAGQQHGLVLLDEAGAVLRPAKLWNDTTSAPQARELVAEYGAETWATGCGSVPVAAFTITKLAWIAANEPHIVDRAAMVMLPHDYLTYRLTGRHVTDRGDASGTGWFSAANDTYNPELLEAAVDRTWLDKLPLVLGPLTAAGTLSDHAAEELGLSANVVVGPGTGDNMAAALGLGLGPGDVAMSLGTSGTVYAISTAPTADVSGLVAGFADASGGFLPLVCTLNATRVTDTVAGWLGTDPEGLSALALAAGSAPGGPVLIPYFDGERAPNLPTATGRISGLTTATTREQLARAAHDGVLCGLFNGLDSLTKAGVATNGVVHLIGGGARSGAYRQRCADLNGTPIVVPDIDETVATGAALQAGAIVKGTAISELASTWSLGAGTTVEPAAGAMGQTTREEYQLASTEIIGAGRH